MTYCHQRTPEATDMILAILGYVSQEAKVLALQRNTSVTKTRDLKDPYHGTIYSHII